MLELSIGQTGQIKPHYFFEIEKNNYILKIAQSQEEILKAQILRFKAFSAVSSGFNNSIDQDEYDHAADHLIVIDKSTQDVVGTYRFFLSDKVEKHYSEREFNIKDFLKLPGRKMELGRASVDPKARAGAIISLLWRGIGEYLRLSKSEFLFGCSSMWDVTPEEIVKLSRVFKYMGIISDVQVLPLATHWCKEFPTDLDELKTKLEITKKIPNEIKMGILYDQCVPTLVKTYINLGSKFTVPPAFDSKLGTYEFFGYVDINNMNPSFKKKYLD